MEINEMKMEDIQARMAEINAELEKPEADIEALTEEVNKLEERATEIKKATEARSALVAKINAGTIGTVIESSEDKEVKTKMNEKEERAQKFVETGKTAIEQRALLSTGKIAKPTRVDGISALADTAKGIIDDVHTIALEGTGAWVAAYQKTRAAAADVTEGQAIGGTGATFDYVTINPAEWGILDEVSHLVKKFSPLAYQTAIEDAAVDALRDKAAEKVIAAVKASELVEHKYSVALDKDFLRNTVLGFRSIKRKGATKLYISQADLATLGAVRGTNEKRALYEITFDDETNTSGTIKEGGLAVSFRVLDGLEDGVQFFGQPGTIDMPLWGDYAIETDEGGDYFKRKMIGIRGAQIGGADVVAYHGMQIIHQAAQS